MIVGTGRYQYRVAEGWGRGAQGYDPGGMVVGVAIDSSDQVYAFRRTPQPSVLVYDRDGHFLSSWGKGIFAEPHAIWIDVQDRVYCTDREDHTVRVFSANGELLLTLGTPGQPGPPGLPFNMPAKAVLSPSGDMWVADGYGQSRIHRFSADGRLLLSWGQPGYGPGQFNLPHSIVIDDRNRVVVVDRENHRLQFFGTDSTFLKAWTDMHQPMDVCIDRYGTIYVAEAYQRVSIFTAGGDLLARWGKAGNKPGQFASFLHGICTDSCGDLYVADERRMQKFERIGRDSIPANAT